MGNSEWDADTIRDWVVQRARPLSYAGAILIVAAAVFFFMREAAQKKNDRAEEALGKAQSAFYSGNTALARTELELVVTRYGGTVAGTQAAMLLAQIFYGEGKHDDGINRLTAAAKTAPSHFAAGVEELIAAGYADSKRYDEAVEHLTKAASKAAFPADRAIYQADAARMLQLAGKPADARKLWEALANDPESPVANEARVRLGELDAKPAAK